MHSLRKLLKRGRITLIQRDLTKPKIYLRHDQLPPSAQIYVHWGLLLTGTQAAVTLQDYRGACQVFIFPG